MANGIVPSSGEFTAVKDNLALAVRESDPNNFSGLTMAAIVSQTQGISQNGVCFFICYLINLINDFTNRQVQMIELFNVRLFSSLKMYFQKKKDKFKNSIQLHNPSHSHITQIMLLNLHVMLLL